MVKLLKKIYNALRWIKIDLRAIAASILEIPRYIGDLLVFVRLQQENKWSIKIYPVFLDRKTEAALIGEYFWQDFLVAKEIINQSPNRHVDVGSRIDGFIAHIALFHKVEVLDIRPLHVEIENVHFTQCDITNLDPRLSGIADCVSCLHTLEHVGLGRYGDKLDPEGWVKALQSLANLIVPGGILWLSVPIGVQRIEFNAHRVFNPATIINSAGKLGLTLSRFFYVTETGFTESKNIDEDIVRFAKEKYVLGIFSFIKNKNENPK